MPRNDSSASEASEFELVLGNRQLLSIFFIVVVLLGVFFTMGYLVGRNSAPVETARNADSYERGNAPSSMPAAAKAPVTIAEEPASASSNEAPVSEPAAAKEDTPAPAAAQPAPKSIDISEAAATEPEPGRTYLQVVSVARPQADALAEVLAKRGFNAFVAPGPNEKTFRVLVGPAANIDDATTLKGKLEAVGMKPIVKKY